MEWTRTVIAASLLLPCSLALSQTPAPKPEVWIAPPGNNQGACLRELFEHPDAWRETRSLVDVLFYADHNLNRQFNDSELQDGFALMQQWGLKFALEVGAIKEWGLTGEKSFKAQLPMWERFQRLGASIDAIALDEPLLCCRKHIHKSDDYAVQQTANFIALVRRHYPEVLIGDIETYPSISLADHRWWIEALNQRLAEMNVRGLDFYRLDVNWAVFVAFNEGSWREVRDLELHCRSKGLPFSLIYWASTLPVLQQKGIADDATWYISIMQQAYNYAMLDGAPDQFVIESWVDAPSRSVPETADFTFTRSVRDFVRTFVTKDPIAPAAKRE